MFNQNAYANRTNDKIEQIKDRLANDNVDAATRNSLEMTLAYLTKLQES